MLRHRQTVFSLSRVVGTVVERLCCVGSGLMVPQLLLHSLHWHMATLEVQPV
jgi:hypothetical protein